jgi:hypothetical protein
MSRNNSPEISSVRLARRISSCLSRITGTIHRRKRWGKAGMSDLNDARTRMAAKKKRRAEIAPRPKKREKRPGTPSPPRRTRPSTGLRASRKPGNNPAGSRRCRKDSAPASKACRGKRLVGCFSEPELPFGMSTPRSRTGREPTFPPSRLSPGRKGSGNETRGRRFPRLASGRPDLYR